MPNINIKPEYYKELTNKNINPTQFVNRLLDQHFFPWKYAHYENELIDKAIDHLEPTDEELEIIHNYLTYEMLRDFKRRMFRRYDHSLPMYSLDYSMKKLSAVIVERGFDQDRIEKYYGHLINDIKEKDPDFNLRTYMDNLIRLKFLPDRQRKVIAKIEQVSRLK